MVLVLALVLGVAWGVALLPDATGDWVGVLGVPPIAGGGSLSLAIIPTLSRVARKYCTTLGMLMYLDNSFW